MPSPASASPALPPSFIAIELHAALFRMLSRRWRRTTEPIPLVDATRAVTVTVLFGVGTAGVLVIALICGTGAAIKRLFGAPGVPRFSGIGTRVVAPMLRSQVCATTRGFP